ncbi:MAG TPA: hypothetical protein VG498_22390, partial [Terriglobales bacterium]|nr:hypothetical protein [Terriglobales bacterium]
MASSPSESAISQTDPGKIAYILLLAALLVAGVGGLAASCIPFSVLLAKARSMSASGQTPFFTSAFYHALQMRLRAISGVNIALVVIIIICRISLTQILSRVLHDARALLTDAVLAFRSVPKLDRFVLVFLLSFAAIFRVPLLTQTMRYDEAYTFLQYSSHPFYAALSFYNAPNNHLLNTLLVRVAYLCLGNHPWALRLPAFLAGLCLVPATYFAHTSLCRVGGALVSAG